nr:MAG TPA: hypothetical protein [Caudoviricetes sp.]
MTPTCRQKPQSAATHTNCPCWALKPSRTTAKPPARSAFRPPVQQIPTLCTRSEFSVS